MDDETLKKYAYVSISSYRAKVVKAMEDDVKTPIKLSKDSGIKKNHISKVLRELKESGVAECINEEAKRGRLYRLTDVGEEIVKHINLEDY